MANRILALTGMRGCGASRPFGGVVTPAQ